MLSWEMMHCRVIRAVDHTQTLYLLVRTRSKDLYTADKLLVGPLVFVICYAVDRHHDDNIMTTSTKITVVLEKRWMLVITSDIVCAH